MDSCQHAQAPMRLSLTSTSITPLTLLKQNVGIRCCSTYRWTSFGYVYFPFTLAIKGSDANAAGSGITGFAVWACKCRGHLVDIEEGQLEGVFEGMLWYLVNYKSYSYCVNL